MFANRLIKRGVGSVLRCLRTVCSSERRADCDGFFGTVCWRVERAECDVILEQSGGDSKVQFVMVLEVCFLERREEKVGRLLGASS